MIRFLNKNDIHSFFDNYYQSKEELPDFYYKRIDPCLNDMRIHDFYGLLEQGVSGLFSEMRQWQPKSYEHLVAQSPKIHICDVSYEDRVVKSRVNWFADAFLELSGRFIRLTPYYKGESIELNKAGSIVYDRYVSLPEHFAKAYYSKLDGMEVIHRLPGAPFSSRVLPAKISEWTDAEAICNDDRRKLEVMRSSLGQIVDSSIKTNSETWSDFKCILDSREQDNFEFAGNAFFVHVGSESKKIFHVVDAEFDKLRLVIDPDAMFDEYIAWVFDGGVGSFDFTDYSKVI